MENDAIRRNLKRIRLRIRLEVTDCHFDLAGTPLSHGSKVLQMRRAVFKKGKTT